METPGAGEIKGAVSEGSHGMVKNPNGLSKLDARNILWFPIGFPYFTNQIWEILKTRPPIYPQKRDVTPQFIGYITCLSVV